MYDIIIHFDSGQYNDKYYSTPPLLIGIDKSRYEADLKALTSLRREMKSSESKNK